MYASADEEGEEDHGLKDPNLYTYETHLSQPKATSRVYIPKLKRDKSYILYPPSTKFDAYSNTNNRRPYPGWLYSLDPTVIENFLSRIIQRNRDDQLEREHQLGAKYVLDLHTTSQSKIDEDIVKERHDRRVGSDNNNNNRCYRPI